VKEGVRMNQMDDPALAPPAQQPSAPDRDGRLTPEPLPWPGMSKAECVLLAILVHRASLAREVGA
jgi:hypothetical protein